ncbi:hypothetical protein GCM10010307_74930 [Streptomyces vastus]|uniref:Uncharacterized protein n=1 Tax=Streptomyces vastus TaxID=285451 RepID=A0ABN3RRH5_9ACTN
MKKVTADPPGDGRPTLRVEGDRDEDWLFETYDLVPPGEELTGLDWDGLVANPLEDH